jgi:hypothetical protein
MAGGEKEKWAEKVQPAGIRISEEINQVQRWLYG